MFSKKRFACVSIIMLLSLMALLNISSGIRIASGLLLTKADRQVRIYEAGRDPMSYEMYGFNNKEMRKVLKKIQNENTWRKYPLDATTNILIDKWHSVMKSTTMHEVLLADSTYIDTIKNIKNGYYLVIDKQKDKLKQPILERKSFNYSLFFLDLDTNTIHYFDFNT